jgi:hypothetical protein
MLLHAEANDSSQGEDRQRAPLTGAARSPYQRRSTLPAGAVVDSPTADTVPLLAEREEICSLRFQGLTGTGRRSQGRDVISADAANSTPPHGCVGDRLAIAGGRNNVHARTDRVLPLGD